MKRLWIIAVLVGAALPASARVVMPAGNAEVPDRRLSIDAGVGVLGYWSGGAAGTSGAWDVRAGYAILPMLTIEGGYVGSAGDAAGPGALIATIFEGDARFNPLSAQRVSPYLLVGAGWGSFKGTSTYQSDNSTVVVPLGAGADVRISDRFVTGARFTYRIVAADNLGPFNSGADHWELVGRVGTRF